MAYTKQTFTSGQILKASDLNTMSEGITTKQDKLVSGTNLKTINGQSLLGGGNITVEGGGDTIISGGTLGAKYAGLYGKKISFLGDSITTFNGYIPSGYAHFYPRNNITSVEKTWWWQFTKTCGLDILVNASWSGSCVTTSRNGSSSSNSTSAAMGCSNKRIADLAKDGITPDIVICFIGANDFGDNVALGSWDGGELPAEGKISTFSEAYALMVSKVMKTYPNAEVFVCTLLEATGSYNGMDDVKTGTYPMAFTRDGATVTLHDYNQKIRKIAEALGANVLDMHSCGITYFNAGSMLGDTLHPNSSGAALMAKKALSELYSKSIYMHPLGVASEPENVYYTVTYKYVDTTGATISPDTTKRVLSGTIISLTTANAPNIMGFTPKSVSPTSVTVSKNTTITFTYEADAETVFHTVTYNYVNSKGIAIKDPTTQRVAEGSSINLTTSLAPSVDGYRVSSVSPSGTQMISGNLTVTFTYNAIVYRTVTYNYVDAEGHAVKESTTEQVESGTSITLNTSTAPIISGYSCTAVSPSGPFVVVENLTVTYTYQAVSEVWYVNTSNTTIRNNPSKPQAGSFAYSNSTTLNACIGVPINAIRLYVNNAGTMSYGKCSSTSYKKLGDITLDNPSNTEAQVYTIPTVTLSDGERLWFQDADDTAKWWYGSNQASNALGYFAAKISTSNPRGEDVSENLSIDIGYINQPDVVKHTVTYEYVNESGESIKDSTSEQIADGTSITTNISNAPAIAGYIVVSVSPSGTIAVSENVTITYTYKAVTETWYVNASTKTSRTGRANPIYGSFAYRHTDTINACIGVPINSLRMFVATAGVMSYGKVSSTAYETLGTINLVNPSNTTLQTYKINEVVLSEGERLWFTAPTDTGMFHYGQRTNSAYPQGAFNVKVSATNLGGNDDPSGGAIENLSIDIGYVR